MDSVKDCVTRMVREILGPPMKAAGFRRTGRVFWRDGDEVCHVAHIAMNRTGTQTHGDFDVHLGVFWHRVEKLRDDAFAGAMPPPENKCTFRIHLGRAVSSPAKRSWKVSLRSDYSAVGRDVLSDIFQYGLPWFEYRSDLSEALESKRYTVRDDDGRLWMQELVNAYAKVIFKVMLGKRDEAIADLKGAISNRHMSTALSLARRLRIPKNLLAE